MKNILLILICSIISISTALSTRSPYFIKKNEISIGFFNKDFWNPNIPHHFSPIIFSATTKVDNGQTIVYERTVYHTHKYFSIAVGANFAHWRRCASYLFTVSSFIAFKWWLFRSDSINPYLIYSIAGPTFISDNTFTTAKLSSAHFLFQDFIGVGVRLGKMQQFDIRLSLLHYSNGDIFINNNGFDVPILISAGISF